MTREQSISVPAHDLFECTYEGDSTHLLHNTITIPSSFIEPLFEEITQTYRSYSALQGFSQDKLPLEYTKNYFRSEIKRDTKHFLFNHFIIDYVFNSLQKNNILFTNWPRLSNAVISDTLEGVYSFDISTVAPIDLKEWKHLIFKSPKRKNYKDLDKQVAFFMKKEQSGLKKSASCIEANDWVCFERRIIPHGGKTPIANTQGRFWIRISPEFIATPFQELFFEKNVGDSFTSPYFPFMHTTQDFIGDPCSFVITISNITKGTHLNMELFKGLFKLKTKHEIHDKLIEVFSYRNDISQRKAIIEELFHLFFTKHRFEIPKHIVTRKKEFILQNLQKEPDYHVYKSHKQFEEHLGLLAEKMLKEEALIDQIAQREDIHVYEEDISWYLHLFNNERLKEFVYFKPMVDAIEESIAPVHENIISTAVRREKTLNHIITTLLR